MSTVIEGFYAGDDFNLEHDVTADENGEGGVIPTDPLVKAWLTIKTAPSVADPGTLQKVITTTPVAGTGHIVQDGSEGNGNGTGSLRFEITAANSAALGTVVRYYYDIQIRTSSGKIYTTQKDRLQLKPGITDATS